jgi:gamma-glutamyl hercynylcysteine S-oxide synthase
VHRQYPGLNAESKKFMDFTQHHPKEGLNFLRDWKDGNSPVGWDIRPVTWGLARGCTNLRELGGTRMEMQYAAEGTDMRS